MPGVVVTGGTGFLGAHVVRALADRDRPVVVADLAPPPAEVLALWAGRPVEYRRLDVREAASVRTLLERAQPDAVVHAAAVTNSADRRTLDEVNVAGTASVLNASGPARVVFVSSASVYQTDGAGPVLDEASAVRRDPGGYPASKLAAEQLASAAGAIIARVAAGFGPLERDTGARQVMSLPYAAVRAALAGRAVSVDPRSAGQCFDPTWVGDIAGALAVLATTEAPRHRLYNVGSGTAVTLEELASAVSAAAGRPEHEGDPLPLRLPDGHRTGRLDVTRLRELPVPAPTALPTALTTYLGWLREHPY